MSSQAAMAREIVKKETNTSYVGETCDNDADYLLKEYRKINKLPEEQIQRLQDLRVQLIHEVPPQHQIEKNAGSHALTKKEKEKFQKFAELRKGPFSPDEDKIICKNWKKFCKIHNWDKRNVKPFFYMRHDKRIIIRFINERKKFVQFLAHNLPNRSLYSVYQRFKKLYSTDIHGRFKPEEDSLILEHIERNPNVDPKHMHADVAKILNRSREAVWRRYQVLKKLKNNSEED